MRSALVVVALCSSCATVAPTLFTSRPAEPALEALAEKFYAAGTPAELRAAVEQAQKLAPYSALTHELAAHLAHLEGRDADAIEHRITALRDTSNDTALLQLHLLMANDFTSPERVRVRDLLVALVERHPNRDVRALATHHLAIMRSQEGDLEARTALIDSLDGTLSFAIVGTWDNDQGKAFESELAPETRSGLDETYEGRAGKLSWRPRAPTDPLGRLDLSQLMIPTRWAAAFAQARVTTKAGPYLLRVLSPDPLKVWVDGKLVFSAPLLDRGSFEHVVIPMQLSAGAHVVLAKSAHREGVWQLKARLTPADGVASMAVTNAEDAMRWHVRELPEGSARRAAHLLAWTHLGAGGTLTVKHADAFLQAAPKSLVARTWLADALWFNQERGRAADVLSALDADVGQELPLVRLRQTRFQLQQGLKLKARTTLLKLAQSNPDVHEVYEQLIEFYRGEGWTEDELKTYAEMDKRFELTADEQLDLGRAQLRNGRRALAVETYQRVLDALPGQAVALWRLADLAQDAGDLELAQRLLERRLDSWSVEASTWLQLAEVRRRLQDEEGARAALAEAKALCPEAAQPFVREGELDYQAGNVSKAVIAWSRAVELNPENEALANRVEFLKPEGRGPWLDDAPDDDALEAAIAQRTSLTQLPGADLAYLLDDQVTLLNNDGSTSSVVSMVIHAFTAQGRDRIMRQSVPTGRLRVLHSYVIDEKGHRTEASSERNRSIFFRGMQPKSTLVLQYRLDAPPQGYLARYFTYAWSFQGAGDQRLLSRLVVWAPASTQLHEARTGSFERTHAVRGEQQRVVWQATNVAPVTAEPSMPTMSEVAANLRLSTVPDWKTWLSWEQALLEGVFRDSPELDALAHQLLDGAADKQEKLTRIHQYVMDEIRYQQDYESFIAGVKPHAAPMVLERKYGDCKDKAVLFIELAKKAGIEAHFALVRTRPEGPVRETVPMQQFNHAIVFVPEQPGVVSRFYDPTAELLDVDSVRSDDVGTRSLVFDPVSATHTWRDLPLQAPDANFERTVISLQLDEKGNAAGTLMVAAKGRSGSSIRRVARNEEMFGQVMQRLATHYLPNARTAQREPVEVQSLRVPAQVQQHVEVSSWARVEGETLRVRLPGESFESSFSLATRRHPLLLGTPTENTVAVSVKLPPGYTVVTTPKAASVKLPCLSFERAVKAEGDTVAVETTARVLCERISAADYPDYRAKNDEVQQLLREELVLGPAKVEPKKKAKKP